MARALIRDVRHSDTADEFIRKLEDRIKDPSINDGERGRLRTLRDAARGAGADLLGDVIARIIEHQTGL